MAAPDFVIASLLLNVFILCIRETSSHSRQRRPFLQARVDAQQVRLSRKLLHSPSSKGILSAAALADRRCCGGRPRPQLRPGRRRAASPVVNNVKEAPVSPIVQRNILIVCRCCRGPAATGRRRRIASPVLSSIAHCPEDNCRCGQGLSALGPPRRSQWNCGSSRLPAVTGSDLPVRRQPQ